MRSRFSLLLALAFGVMMFGACSTLQTLTGPDDKAIVSDVQAKLYQDSTLKTRDIRVASDKGVVTLTGTVSTDLEKSAAEKTARDAKGVKQVVDQLEVAPATAAAAPAPAAEAPPAAQAEAPPAEARPAKKTRASSRRAEKSSAPAATASAEPAQTPPPAQKESAPPPPPQPVSVTIPEGSVIQVRMVDGVDSSKNRAGEEFGATTSLPVAVGDQVIIPMGSDVRVRLVQAQSAGHMTGQADLQLQLVSVNIGGQSYQVQTSTYQQVGASRGKRTAETVGGGAVLGGLIGAIAGKGKGAAIGAGIGAAAGAGAQAATHGPSVKVAPETKLEFTLKAPLTVTR